MTADHILCGLFVACVIAWLFYMKARFFDRN